ncbi:MAG: hypothetical protein LBM96_08455 [Methanobrevibacter sp.]|jgi:hypothetical protein|nr:hypothetical protein [Candidatus Methanoflexus mossambicus]
MTKENDLSKDQINDENIGDNMNTNNNINENKLEEVSSEFFTSDKVFINFNSKNSRHGYRNKKDKVDENKINLFEILDIQKITKANEKIHNGSLVYEFDEFFVDNDIFNNDKLFSTASDSEKDIILCLYAYGEDSKLDTKSLKNFIYVAYAISKNNTDYLSKSEYETYRKSNDFLNSLNNMEDMDNIFRYKVLLDFIKTNSIVYVPLEKKSVMLSKSQIDKIDQLEGKGFSEKIRVLVDEYFNEMPGIKKVHDFKYNVYLCLHSFNLDGKTYEVTSDMFNDELDAEPIHDWQYMTSFVLKYLKDKNPKEFHKKLMSIYEEFLRYVGGDDWLIEDLNKLLDDSKDASDALLLHINREFLEMVIWGIDESIDLSFNVWTIGGKDPDEVTIDVPLHDWRPIKELPEIKIVSSERII